MRRWAAGRPVHVLTTDGASFGPLAGIHVHHISTFHLPADYRVPNLYEPGPVDVADRVRFAMERLHTAHPFGAIELPVRGGLGLRTIQAKQAGLAFGDAQLVARLDGTSRRERESGCRWPAGLDELERDYAERYTVEYADTLVADDVELLAAVRRGGWQAPGGGFGRVCEGASPLVTIGVPYYNLGRYLPDTLTSVAAQTYPHLEVIVVDDGSTDAGSRRAFDELAARHPSFRFVRQPNAGIGATRNRCLREARGELFLPVDADNVARPDMVAKFVTAMRRNPHLTAMTCYYTAFADDDPGRHLYAVRPAGGPYAMAAIRNVYGDANAVFRTADLRAVGGYEEDRGTSCEDWELFVKLVSGGRRVGVVPDHLFAYRHRDAGFSRVTNRFANHQRVLRQFERCDRLPPGEAAALWPTLLGLQQENERLKDLLRSRRHRLADRLHAAGRRLVRAVSRRS